VVPTTLIESVAPASANVSKPSKPAPAVRRRPMPLLRPELPSGPMLNLGCGPVQPRGWVNVDGSHRAWFAAKLAPVDRLLTALGIFPKTEFGPHVRVLDLRKPLPFADGTVAAIYSGEAWEHFEPQVARRLTQECYRVLAPGGVLRVCVPDGVQFFSRYLDLIEKANQAPRGSRAQSVAEIRRHVQLYFNDICTRRPGLGSMGHFHKWQYDEPQLLALFEECGFLDVERMPYRDSRIPNIADVERSDFLIVEGVKPDLGGEVA